MNAPERNFTLNEPAPRTTIEEERRYRKERLAATFRLFARQGYDHGLAGHVTARDPEYPDRFWVNPFGKHFGRIRVSDLLLVDHQGNILVGDQPVNKAAFAIHSALHAARPDIVSAAHTHSTYGKAWSSLGRLLDPLTQDATAFYGDHVLFDDYTGVVWDQSEGQRIAAALGNKKAAILRNHGLLTTGPSVEAAAWWFISMDNAAHTQLLAEAAGTPKPLSHEVASLTAGQVGGHRSAALGFHSLWEALVEEEPDFLD
ncbi:class II aldolase/adducin family protein [Pseudothauera rhizosphaerae]|uniref:Class II aldolase/adducin family protein n=2 Tax=Pseudothauera rhizosphaerae TaxID=2565932 RepID=A0A4S4AYR4_9RHOO|nr:class II aldolase/adducin family protein [Pseudothauera rhizosphaerae]